FQREPASGDGQLPMEEVETPNTPTIQSLADFLGIPVSRTAKAVFYRGGSGRFIFAVVRGDHDVNETKLRNATGESDLVAATAEEIRAIGAEPGYGSPVGVHDAFVVVDESVRDTPNLVAGANRPGYHLRNVNLERDYTADLVTDIVAAPEGAPCPVCGTPMRAERAIEVGNIFKLGTRYSEAMGATYLDPDGKAKPVVMGSYGIGVGRAAATAVEQHHDERGIRWPISIAPFQVSLLSLGREENVAAATDALYTELTANGIEVLYDDRNDRPGVKFNDADLIGNPIRLSISKRTVENNEAELRLRSESESVFVALDDVVPIVRSHVDAMVAALQPG
ncbi:MAG: His/Gly/Thr/Pro-type tRNA ligase C-terminal domain-containing protein, partial [Chloroflexota bacterium]|nr:His/Gly/Thr/Pro-type tRNA ligase C-terminal domain-containing protein [Chloroflexota bacterium]